MAKRASNIRELAIIRADSRVILNELVGNQGTALGRKNYSPEGNPEGEPCIIVYVPHKIHNLLLLVDQRIPELLVSNDGTLEAPTDVVVTTSPNQSLPLPTLSTFNQDLVASLQWKDRKLDYIGPGVQIGAEDQEFGSYEGTLGYVVKSKHSKQIGILTNQHIGLRAGQSIYIPGVNQKDMRLGVTRKVLEHIPDDLWFEKVDEKFAYIKTDASFVVAEERALEFLRNEIPGVGRISKEIFPINMSSMEIIGKKVKKVGRTTGLQKGTIVAVGYGVPGEDEAVDRRLGVEPANIYTDLLIAPNQKDTVFSAYGDSGSAILIDSNDQDNNRPVGLLWGGWPSDIGRKVGVEDLTYGIGLEKLLNAMDLKLL